MTTYSQAVTGIQLDVAQGSFTQSANVPDTSMNGNSAVPIGQKMNLGDAGSGGMQNCTRLGDQILVKGPDGQLVWHRYDAERSTPNVPVLVPVSSVRP